MGILIKNGEIITASDRFVGDVYCEDGKIVAVGPGLDKQRAVESILRGSIQMAEYPADTVAAQDGHFIRHDLGGNSQPIFGFRLHDRTDVSALADLG